MSTDRARINGQNVTCYFREKDVHDPQSAAGLMDPGQDNRSRQFAPGTGEQEILAACESKGFDRLYLAGRLQDAPVGIGVDLKSFEIAVTVPRSRRELIGTLSRAVTQPFETAF